MINLEVDKEKVDRFINDYIESLKINESKRKEMFSNYNYLKWLESFTIEHPSFSDDDWLYFPEQISETDNENVKNLHLLYEGIEFYAKKNYIYPTKCDFGYYEDYYNLKLDNVSYELGRSIGQGTLFFCRRKPLNIDLEYIDFNDIISDKKKDGIDVITKQLKDLSSQVLKLYKNGVPLDALIETLDTTLTEIEKEEENSKKTFKRTKSSI